MRRYVAMWFMGSMVVTCLAGAVTAQHPQEGQLIMALDATKVVDVILDLRKFLYSDQSLKGQVAFGKDEHKIIDGALEQLDIGKPEGAVQLLQVSEEKGNLKHNPNYWLLLAYAKHQLGDIDGARQSVRQLLSIPKLETRLMLSAWSVLRELGQTPENEEGKRVRGVVVEIDYRDRVIIVAGYEDGTSRLLFGEGGGILGEKEDFPIESLVAAKELIRSTQSLIGKVPLEGMRQLPKQNHVRFALLTTAGIYAAEESIDKLEKRRSPLSPAWTAANQLLGILLDFIQARKKSRLP